MFSARMRPGRLSELCRRVGTSLQAGVDQRRVWRREAERGARSARWHLAQVSQAIDRGATCGEALAAAGDYFPPLIREMARVGEETGKLPEVLLKLAHYYDHLRKQQAALGVAILWPVLQLVVAVVVIGILIAVMGWIGGMTGESADVLGFGLVGTSGVLVYACIIAGVVLLGWLLVRFVTRGPLAASLTGAVMQLPLVGPHLQAMSLARMTWSLSLAIDAGMDAQQSLRVALDSTRNPFFTRHAGSVARSIDERREIHETLRLTGAFPDQLVDAVEAGEASGQLAEAMQALSNHYEERARTTAGILTTAAALAIWMLVAGILIFLIFRVFNAYLGIIEGFL